MQPSVTKRLVLAATRCYTDIHFGGSIADNKESLTESMTRTLHNAEIADTWSHLPYCESDANVMSSQAIEWQSFMADSSAINPLAAKPGRVLCRISCQGLSSQATASKDFRFQVESQTGVAT